MKVEFTKMHAAGNDFVVVDGLRQSVNLSAGQIKYIADRQRGVGCDQLLQVDPPDHPDADFRYRIFNADGSGAGQCGNGARCFARFVREQRLTAKRDLKIQTDNGLMQLLVAEDGRIQAELGSPLLAPEVVPFHAESPAIDYAVDIAGETFTLGVVSMGNPHAVMLVDDCASAAVIPIGTALQDHPRFPDRVNAGFMQVVNRQHVQLRVYERGAGETLACGSGACAAVVYGIRKGLLDRAVTVQLPGGKLTVEWPADDSPVWLGGPTSTVFHGVIRLRGR